MLRYVIGLLAFTESCVNVPVVLMLSTLPDAAAADALAQAVLETRLAACVTNLGAVSSQYHWKGALESSQEVQLLFKTSVARSDELQRFIDVRHPYETPEILVWQVDASPGYGQWVNVETQRPLHV
ncbi:periplasmic cytochrome biogenesis protein [Caballeronia hypogeia]|uniref:Periplasmic cytochrome biogenesis protein n=1 Tax=Caballeronia hypogeia TaxID=1777140 RepID=A0A158CRX6_9BURK|nr:periplasmic cytochrome biogenesis protein [Caballeronia hypogeia]